jgi:dTDP-4-amino-4,6-dideoxygalactose transaminase
MNNWPNYSDEEIESVCSVLKSGNVNYWTGRECKLFEEEFANWSETKYAVALSNGTVALDLALWALKISSGDEVIVTSRTFIASVSSIVNAGATPVFVDVDKESGNISTDGILHAISKKTKAIICVHLAGWPCDMDEISDISNKNNLYVIEDCAQAHGASYKGRPVGSIGDIGCWSFCQDKIITTGGEGGMITTNNKSLWLKIWEYKDHGKSHDSVFNKTHLSGYRWLHDSFGSNYRMTEMQGAIGRIQLKKIDDWQTIRLKYCKRIWNAAKSLKGLRVPEVPSFIEHACYKCYIYVEHSQLKKGWNRDVIQDEIVKMGISCFSGTCSEVYLEKAFNETNFPPSQRLIIAKELGETSLMFLVHPSLSNKDIENTCEAITQVMEIATK